MYEPGDDELCVCFHVSQRKLAKHLRLNNLRFPSQLSECYSAGTGCGWCIPYLEKMFEAHQQGKTLEEFGMTQEEYRARRLEYLKSSKRKPPNQE
ncbi:MAG: (2Fe-2S)-binding protein [Candidatus Sumerlaeia bacterium]|nr:(2Fe-2S)-binding protein [Candidatus Sumerlaeia bacterium]